MNYCVNHSDAAVTAYCQNCGKGLCSACARTAQGSIFCEPCLAARTAGAPGFGAAAPASGPGASSSAPGAYGGPPPPGWVPPAPGPNPGTATLLGFIPGVGAMYNGQYIKAIVHVLVFVVLVGMANRFWFFGLLIGFWVLYQVFDAHQTAKARRDGLPLPDPFGLNELGNRIGGHTGPVPPHVPPPVPPAPGVPPPPGAAGTQANPYADWAEQVRQQAHQWGEQAGQWGEQFRARVVAESSQGPRPYPPSGSAAWGGGPVASGFTSPMPPSPGGWAAPPPPPAGWAQPGYVPPGPVPPGAVPPVPPIPPIPPNMELERARREPIGAIVLILLGMLFLFNTLGFFSFGWVTHGWPLIVVAVAIWLLARSSPRRFGFAPPFTPKPPDAPQDSDPNRPGGGQ